MVCIFIRGNLKNIFPVVIISQHLNGRGSENRPPEGLLLTSINFNTGMDK